MGVTKPQASVLLSSKNNPIKSSYQKLFDILEVDPLEVLVPREKKDVQIDVEAKNAADVVDLKSAATYVDTKHVAAVRPYTSVELFAGAGGLALGLEKAGFQAKGLVEIDKHAAATLRENRPEWNVIEDDVVKVAEAGIRQYLHTEIDFVSGGYPCQAFSYAGKKMGLDDVRGTMFFYFAKIINELQPKVFWRKMCVA